MRWSDGYYFVASSCEDLIKIWFSNARKEIGEELRWKCRVSNTVYRSIGSDTHIDQKVDKNDLSVLAYLSFVKGFGVLRTNTS